jgi:hypothetical protein
LPEHIITTIQSMTSDKLLIVSDRSSLERRGMLFGVTIGTSMGTFLPTCILGTAVFNAQQTIGWQLLLICGIFADEWTTLLQQSILQTLPDSAPSVQPPDVTTILSGMIKILWSELGTCGLSIWTWLIHEKANNTRISPVSLEAMGNRVRMVHSLKERTFPIHSHYFHDDIEGYLQDATLQSMTTYVDHYYPVIQASLITDTTFSAKGSASHTSPDIRQHVGEPSHRKRNRRRTILHRIADAIRTMLSTTPHPSFLPAG